MQSMYLMPQTLRLQMCNHAFGGNSLPNCRAKLSEEGFTRTHTQSTRFAPPNQIQIDDVRSQSCPSSRRLQDNLGCIATVGLLQPNSTHICGYSRGYSLCCPPRPPPGCGCPVPGGGRKIVPPSTCRPGPIPPNPCVPVFHGKNQGNKFKYIFFFICIPLIIIQALRAFSGHYHKDECRDYEYMRIRTKRFPWGDGVKSFFHNDEVNFLPGECEPPPLDCD